MGKGDKKSRRGKIALGTYGVRRPRKKKKKNIPNIETSGTETDEIEAVALKEKNI